MEVYLKKPLLFLKQICLQISFDLKVLELTYYQGACLNSLNNVLTTDVHIVNI